jgi:thioredoxin reductase
MRDSTDVTVIGAGPYGLSIAAYLRGAGVEHRTVGSPMHSWTAQMPKGMLLKSEGFASSLYDPDRQFTLERFCRERGIPYSDLGLPVAIETFNTYGLEFQKRFVPDLENTSVKALSRTPNGFLIELGNGETFASRRVVLAIGISYFDYLPPELAPLPSDLVSHSSAHSDLGRFKGRDVVVLGAGASAIDTAVLLRDSGANVQLVARRAAIEFGEPGMYPRPLWDRIRAPMSGVGPGWRQLACTEIPTFFRYLPEERRLDIVRRFLGPSPGWFMRERFAGIPSHMGHRLRGAEPAGTRVRLRLTGPEGQERDISTEHVIAATGFRVDLRRISFLDRSLRDQIRSVEQTPVLGPHYQSSVLGLYFVGLAAANSYGPAMRFAVGAKATARDIARHLARGRAANSRTGMHGEPVPTSATSASAGAS